MQTSQREGDSSESSEESDFLPDLLPGVNNHRGGLDDYVLALMENQDLCRPEMRAAYQRLIRLLSSPDAFIGRQLSLLPHATPAQQICMLNFLRDYTIA